MGTIMPYNPAYIKKKNSVDNEELYKISTVFGSNFLRSIIQDRHEEKCELIIRSLRDNFDLHITNYIELFENAYRILFWHYKTEYVFKNALFNKKVLSNNNKVISAFITELRINDHTLDVLIPGQKVLPIEIKSPLDGMGRINGQIETFKNIFPYLFVLSDFKKLDYILKATTNDIGILILTNRYQFKVLRYPTSDYNKINSESMFDSLRVSEYSKALKTNRIMNIPNVKRYDVAKEEFCKLETEISYNRFLNVMKERRQNIKLNELKAFPHSLRFTLYNSKVKLDRFQRKIIESLN